MTGLIIFTISLISATVQTVSGFGYGIVVMSILPIILPYPEAQALSTCGSILLNVAILRKAWPKIQYKAAVLPLVFAAMGTLGGLLLMANKPSPIYKQMLGVFLCILAVYFVFFSARIRIRASYASSAVAGIVSGVCGGLFSISGPPMVLYFVSIFDDIDHYMATTQFYFFVNNIILITTRVSLGLWPSGIWQNALLIAAGLILGVWVGRRIYSKIDPKQMKKFIYAFMALAGIYIAFGG